MSDDVPRLTRLAAEICFLRNRTHDDGERRRLNAELHDYVTLIAAARDSVPPLAPAQPHEDSSPQRSPAGS